MTYKLFIDDERSPPGPLGEWVVARSVFLAKHIIEQRGMPDFISFDHDLGEDVPTGYDLAKWLVDQDLDGVNYFHPVFEYTVHSQNPVGKANIEGLMDQYLKEIFG